MNLTEIIKENQLSAIKEIITSNYQKAIDVALTRPLGFDPKTNPWTSGKVVTNAGNGNNFALLIQRLIYLKYFHNDYLDSNFVVVAIISLPGSSGRSLEYLLEVLDDRLKYHATSNDFTEGSFGYDAIPKYVNSKEPNGKDRKVIINTAHLDSVAQLTYQSIKTDRKADIIILDRSSFGSGGDIGHQGAIEMASLHSYSIFNFDFSGQHVVNSRRQINFENITF